MTFIRKVIVIIGLIGLLIYGVYLVKCRLGIDVDEYHHAGDYISAIVHMQWFADATSPSSLIEEKNVKDQDAQPVPATITVDVAQTNGTVNKRIFGNNIIAYDPNTYENWGREYYGLSDYGAGIWDPKREACVKEVIKLAKDAGVSVMRFPGGCGTHHYNWKKSIGKKRTHFLYGLDEFLKSCQEIGAEAIITVSFFSGTEQDAADLVEYLNGADNGKHPWAAKRAANGHPEPYDVKYFEIGNEVYHGDHQNVKRVEAVEYVRKYLRYYEVMKAVDPAIKVGVVLTDDEWDETVAEGIGGKVDFGITHVYPSPADGEALGQFPPKEIFLASLALPELQYQKYFERTLAVFRKHGGKDLPLAITEYNGGFVQDKPIPYRHCLGTALLNAELLRIFMHAENNILMANYWNFNNSYTGMIANGFTDNYRDLYKPYFKRPNYYALKLYAKHFGDALLKADIRSGGYHSRSYGFVGGLPEGKTVGGNMLSEKWQVVPQDGIEAKTAGDALEVEFIAPKKFNYYHSSRGATIEPGQCYRFSGYIRTENLESDAGVGLEVQDVRGYERTKFAVATRALSGTTDWTHVQKVFWALPDARGAKVIARHNSNSGPLRGKAFFKDIRLEKFIPSIDTQVPYLSVNASKSKDGSKLYLMVINKNMDESMTSTIDLKGFGPAEEGEAWILNGPSIDATNEKRHDNVKVTQKKFRVWSKESGVKNSFEYTFEPHSLTAIEIERFKK
jgi:alpha-N-arabinofuranosidase